MQNIVFAQMIFSQILPYYFIPKSEWIPLVSVLNNFIKIYSNTMKYGLQ